MTRGLRVLITNNALAVRAGSELYVRDLASALLARGHTPIAYSTELGEVARELRAATVPVVDRLEALGTPPDIIHGQHHLDTMTALLHFPGVPAVYFCHGWAPWQEAAPRFPRLRHYVAVDQTCADRLRFEDGIPEECVRVLLNFVDLERFPPRAPLPPRPQRALLFGNMADGACIAAVRAACDRAGLSLDVAGARAGAVAGAPEALLGDYDLVFAKARAAIEALAIGTAVVLCDAIGTGPMVTSANFDALRACNFGIRALRGPLTADALAAEVRRYDAADATAVSRRVRAEAGRDAAVDEIVVLYREVLAEHAAQPAPYPDAERAAAARYLRWLASCVKTRVSVLEQRADHLAAQCQEIAATRDRLIAVGQATDADVIAARDRVTALVAERDAVDVARADATEQLRRTRDVHAALTDRYAAVVAERDRLAAELTAMRGSLTVRVRERILATRFVGAFIRGTLRWAKSPADGCRPRSATIG